MKNKYEREIYVHQILNGLFKRFKSILIIGLVMAGILVSFKYITAGTNLKQQTQIKYRPVIDYLGTTKIFMGKEMDTNTAEAIRTYLIGYNVIQSVIDELELDIEYETLINSISLNGSTDTITVITVVGNDKDEVQLITESIANIGCNKVVDKFNDKDIIILEPAYTVEREYNVEVSKLVISYKNLLTALLKYAIIGFFLGVLAAASIYTIIFLIDPTIQTDKDIEGYLDVPVLAIIPVIEGTEKSVDKIKRKNRWRLIKMKIFSKSGK